MADELAAGACPSDDVTRLLQLACEGDGDAREQLYAHVYDELRRLAQAHMGAQAPGETLQPTALVHEAWMRLARPSAQEGGFENREHFLALASRAMRCALVDQARRRNALKRGGDRERVSLELAIDQVEQRGIDVIALHEALDRLARDEPRQAQVVELRFFGGLSLPEAARALEVSRATVDRDWRMARIWLREELRTEPA